MEIIQYMAIYDWLLSLGLCMLYHVAVLHFFLLLGNIPLHRYAAAAAAAAKSLQSCLTLCDPMDSSPPGSPVPGISREEHWSGLPFPSPMHESEKSKWSRSVMSDS